MKTLLCSLLALGSLSLAQADRLVYDLEAWNKGFDLFPTGLDGKKLEFQQQGLPPDMIRQSIAALEKERALVKRDRTDTSKITFDTDGKVFRAERMLLASTFGTEPSIPKKSMVIEYGTKDLAAEYGDWGPDKSASGQLKKSRPSYGHSAGTWMAPWVFGAFDLDELELTSQSSNPTILSRNLETNGKVLGRLEVQMGSNGKPVEFRQLNNQGALSFVAKVEYKNDKPEVVTMRLLNIDGTDGQRRTFRLTWSGKSPSDVNLDGMGPKGVVVLDGRRGGKDIVPRTVTASLPAESELTALAKKPPMQVGGKSIIPPPPDRTPLLWLASGGALALLLGGGWLSTRRSKKVAA